MRRIMPDQRKDKHKVGFAPPFFIAVEYCVIVFVLALFSSGCSTNEGQRLSFEQRLSVPYDRTNIKESLTLDVLPMIQRSPDQIRPGYDGTELLSKGLNAVAALGQDKDGYQTWYNMFAFHQYRLNVIRKYFFFVDDRPGMFATGRGRGLRFDCEQVLTEELLGSTYATTGDRQVAILRYVLENLRNLICVFQLRSHSDLLNPALASFYD